MEVGAKVWARYSASDPWFKGTVITLPECPSQKRRSDVLLTRKFTLLRSKPDGTDTDINVEIISDMVDGEYGDYELIKLQNTLDSPPEEVDDLTVLYYLNEPSIVEILRDRFRKDLIYTNSGAILLVVNPFKPLPIYTNEKIELYRNWGVMEENSKHENRKQKPVPHVFLVADGAYRDMTNNGSQSILVSGESGAGKTFTTKVILHYLAKITKSNNESDDTVSASESECAGRNIEDKVLQSNPILESFGNACTLMNDNSSRFGKFIEIKFDNNDNDSYKMVGATIRTYLLEKARIVQHGKGERNFHCFYELLKGATRDDLSRLHLTSITDYWYTTQSGQESRGDGVYDEEQYKATRAAMGVMKLSIDDQNSIYNVVAALLHLGNITFDVKPSVKTDEIPCSLKANRSNFTESGDSAVIASSCSHHVEYCCELLGIDRTDLEKVLCEKQVRSREMVYTKSQTVIEATWARDALAKSIYGALFDFIAGQINVAIAAPVDEEHDTTFIGVLDIFGFESCAVNSFEQLCINMANEHLQQHFNEFVFNDEQKLYARESITWSNVAYPDNSKVMQLLDGKTGIFALCDEQVLFPNSTDRTMMNKFYEYHKSHGRFHAGPADVADYKFVIKHFAGPVKYSSEGFLDKNRNTIRVDMSELISQSKLDFICGLADSFRLEEAAGSSKRITKSKLKTKTKTKVFSLSGEFRKQLTELMTNINTTTPNYIRCLKPNSKNVAGVMEESLITEQLRCNGVLEAVRIHQMGYPNRVTFQQFVRFYGGLVPCPTREGWSVDNLESLGQKLAEQILASDTFKPPKDSLNDSNILSRAGIQIGVSMVFMRKVTYDHVEIGRLAKQRFFSAFLVTRIRGYLYRFRFRRLRRVAVTVQCWMRQIFAGRRMKSLKRHRAAVLIQRMMRGFLSRIFVSKTMPDFRSTYMNVLIMKEKFKHMAIARLIKANLIAKTWRRYTKKRIMERHSQAAVLIQSMVRRHIHKGFLPKKRIQVLRTARLERKKLATEMTVLCEQFVTYLNESKKKTSCLLPGRASRGDDSLGSALDGYESILEVESPLETKQSLAVRPSNNEGAGADSADVEEVISSQGYEERAGLKVDRSASVRAGASAQCLAAAVTAKVAKAMADHRAHEDVLLSNVSPVRTSGRQQSASLAGRCVLVDTKSGWQKVTVLNYIGESDEFVVRGDDGRKAKVSLFALGWRARFCSMLRPFVVGDDVMAVYQFKDKRRLETWHHARVVSVSVNGSTLTVTWIGLPSSQIKTFDLETDGHRVLLVEEGMSLSDRNKPQPLPNN